MISTSARTKAASHWLLRLCSFFPAFFAVRLPDVDSVLADAFAVEPAPALDPALELALLAVWFCLPAPLRVASVFFAVSRRGASGFLPEPLPDSLSRSRAN